MSMVAHFVQVRPNQLAELLANPSSVSQLIETTAGLYSGLDHQELQVLAEQRLQQAAARKGEAAQIFASLAATDPGMREMMAQVLGNQGVNIDSLDGDKGGDVFLAIMEQSLQPLLHPPPTSRQVDQGIALSLEKAWHGVHYLLCGEVEAGQKMLSKAVLGGSELGGNLGYGPARYLRVEQAAGIARELSRADLEMGMQSRFDPKIMSSLGIYPGSWSERAIEGLMEEFRNLRDFYIGAAAGGVAVVTCIV